MRLHVLYTGQSKLGIKLLRMRFRPIDNKSIFHLYGGLAVLSHFHMPPILKLCIIRFKRSCSLKHTTLKTKVIKSSLNTDSTKNQILPIHENFANLHDSHQD